MISYDCILDIERSDSMISLVNGPSSLKRLNYDHEPTVHVLETAEVIFFILAFPARIFGKRWNEKSGVFFTVDKHPGELTCFCFLIKEVCIKKKVFMNKKF